METQEREHSLRIVKFKNDIIEVLGLNFSPLGGVPIGKDKGNGYCGGPHPGYVCAAVADNTTQHSL